MPLLAIQDGIILISGDRQIGKTTLLLRLREHVHAAGLQTGGFLSVARFESAAKTGIDLMDAATGATMPLAEYRDTADPTDGAIRTPHYVFHPAALEAGIRFAESGRGADVFFVDELGPLELRHSQGWAAVIPLIAARQSGVSLVVVRPELLDIARQKLGLEPDSPQITVDSENRDVLAAEWSRWLAAHR